MAEGEPLVSAVLSETSTTFVAGTGGASGCFGLQLGGHTFYDDQDPDDKHWQKYVYEQFFDVRYGRDQAYHKLLKCAGEIGMEPEPSLGLHPRKLVNLWSTKRVFTFLMLGARGSLNLYEATKLVITMQAFWLEDYAEGSPLHFLQHHRKNMITVVFGFECAMLWLFLLSWLWASAMFFCGRNVAVRFLIDNPKMLANFSVLQAACFINWDVFYESFNTYWKPKMLAVIWEFSTGGGRKNTRRVLPTWCGTCIMMLGYVVWPVLFVFFICMAFACFLSKISFEVGDLLYKHTYEEWTWDSYMNFFAFINNCAGIIDWDRWSRNRLLLFRFGGSDAQWSPREMAMMWKWHRALATFLALYLRSRSSTLLVLGTLNAKDFQYLLVGDKRKDDNADPEPWMYMDLLFPLGAKEEAALGDYEITREQDDSESD